MFTLLWKCLSPLLFVVLTSLHFGSNPNLFYMYRDSSTLHLEGHGKEREVREYVTREEREIDKEKRKITSKIHIYP